MPTLSSTFAIADEIWVVEPTQPALFHGTIIGVVLTEYSNSDGDIVDKVDYNILLDDDIGTLKSTEDYMELLQADAMTLLATLIDDTLCY